APSAVAIYFLYSDHAGTRARTGAGSPASGAILCTAGEGPARALRKCRVAARATGSSAPRRHNRPDTARATAPGMAREGRFVNRRLIYLDVVRGIAILLVLGAHTAYAIWPEDSPHTWVRELFLHWQRIGPSGVLLFFALSGFLIGGLLLQ